ncbi:hypothetical protein PAPYR_9589 [Paratrimastix pyriformis]|uniref:Uncharacterized protein n=1 Tax=Paratrimastix pyriformis TaxID=342808 RepID=A0ABQ8U7Y0_9EUKA|nr:hypothetical protein PAPYR_9589 [Paratrimastix pyriformis]
MEDEADCFEEGDDAARDDDFVEFDEENADPDPIDETHDHFTDVPKNGTDAQCPMCKDSAKFRAYPYRAEVFCRRSPTASVLAEPEDEAFFALPERLEKFFLTGTAPPKQQAKPVNRRAHRAKRSARDPLATATSPVPISPEECEARDITQTTPALSLTASRGGDQERLDVPAVARLDALHLTDVPPTTAHPGKVTRGGPGVSPWHPGVNPGNLCTPFSPSANCFPLHSMEDEADCFEEGDDAARDDDFVEFDEENADPDPIDETHDHFTDVPKNGTDAQCPMCKDSAKFRAYPYRAEVFCRRSPTASVLAEPEDEAFFALPERLEKFFLTGTAPKQQAKPVNRRAHRAKRSARDPLATATSPVPISPEECEARDITQTTPALSLTASRGGDQERLDVPAVARLDALHLTDVPPTTAHPGKVTRGAARGKPWHPG